MLVVRRSTGQGQRHNSHARAVRVGGKTLVELCGKPSGELVDWVRWRQGPEKNETNGGGGEEETGRKGDKEKKKKSQVSPLGPTHRIIAGELLKEIRARLGFLLNVGLHYLTLDRTAPTLAGGEAQRIRLASQIGCARVGVLYILHETRIGL